MSPSARNHWRRPRTYHHGNLREVLLEAARKLIEQYGPAGFSLSGGFWPGAIPINNCPADINGDHSVSVNDLLAVITNWGSCALPCPPRCAADLSPATTGDCAVNVNDLLLVITNWGACPP